MRLSSLPRFSVLLLCGSSLIGLTACGGSGGNSSSTATPVAVVPPPPPPPPAPSSNATKITVTGPIDGFGSVIVNGVRYDTGEADVEVGDDAGNITDLSVGQVISLRARNGADGETPIAERIRYEDLVKGPVDSIPADGSTLVVLGQTVRIADALFEPSLDPATIAVDDVLEVSGVFNADGEIEATYVERSDDDDYEVHGFVTDLDETAQTFRIQDLTVGYATAALEDFDDGETLSNGDLVEVEGSTRTNDGTLIATEVEYEGDDLDELRGDADEAEAEIYGFVSVFTSAENFEVNGIVVVTDDDTVFERCSRDTIALNTPVEVEGVFDGDGVLLADAVKCELEANNRIEARVDDVDAEAGTVTVLNVTVATDAGTRFQDKSDARVREFGLDDIQAGDVVHIRFFDGADDALPIAKRIRREDAEDFEESEVRGVLESIEGDDIVVAGVRISLNAQTEYELDEFDVSRMAFFDVVDIGSFVKIEGREGDDGNLVAHEVERELEDDDSGDGD